MSKRFLENWVYHIYNRWLEKMIIFKNEKDFEKFYKIIVKNLEKYKTIKIISYSFLPNHFHFIVNNTGTELSDFFWNICNSYAKYFNTKYERKWSLFEWRFQAKIIVNEEYLLKCLSYVNFNPMKHEIVKNINDYKWTSYNQFTNKETLEKYKGLILDELEF